MLSDGQIVGGFRRSAVKFVHRWSEFCARYWAQFACKAIVICFRFILVAVQSLDTGYSRAECKQRGQCSLEMYTLASIPYQVRAFWMLQAVYVFVCRLVYPLGSIRMPFFVFMSYYVTYTGFSRLLSAYREDRARKSAEIGYNGIYDLQPLTTLLHTDKRYDKDAKLSEFRLAIPHLIGLSYRLSVCKRVVSG